MSDHGLGRRRSSRFRGGAVWLFIALAGCVSNETKPIDIYPEDICSTCRMAFSDHRFASEIINDKTEVFKFDDIGCMMQFKDSEDDLKIIAMYLKDYDTREWIRYERAFIVETNVRTPMGSGKVAFADSSKAVEFQKMHPKN